MSDENSQVASPGEAPPKPEKAKRPTRVDFPVPEGGFDEWPAEWDAAKHRGLMRHNFKDERVWLRKKIEFNKAEIAKFEAEIKKIDEFGPTKRSGSSKLAAVTANLNELLETLKAAGIDPEELKKQLAAKAAAA